MGKVEIHVKTAKWRVPCELELDVHFEEIVDQIVPISFCCVEGIGSQDNLSLLAMYQVISRRYSASCCFQTKSSSLFYISSPWLFIDQAANITSSIYLLMDKLAQITVENSLNLVVSYQVDQSLLARNFVTIVNALKELKEKQALSESKIKDLTSLVDKQNSLSQRLDKIQKGSSHNTKQTAGLSNDGLQNISNLLSNLTKRVDKNENTILDNIKDINLLNKDLSGAKNDIQDLKKRLGNLSNAGSKGDQGNNIGYNINDIAQNLNKQLSKSQQTQKSLANRLSVAEENIQKLQKDLKNLLQRRQNQGSGSISSNNNLSDRDLQDLKKDMKQKLEVINKKINNLQSDTDQHERDIAQLKDFVSQSQANKGEKVDQEGNDKNGETSKTDLSQLRKRIEEVNEKEKKDVRALQQEINNLKLQLKGLSKAEKIDSKTSLQEQNQKSRRTLSKDRDQLNDKLNDLILKVAYLQKLIAGSKNSLSDERNPEKLPNIGRPRKREGNMTMYQQKEKSGITRKDLAELKAELQAWLKSLLQQNQQRENFQGLELKLQEIRRNVEKKADGQGTKKGFSFLQNKITQLYLFLTEPQSQDAMIVRKGFNCLSCSKKVQKLRGKLGPHLNWNNMTSTNYSPPRVGYSKPMGQNSGEKEDDL